MTKKLLIGLGVLGVVGVALVAQSRIGDSQPAGTPAKLTVAIYAPTVQFSTSQARIAYVQGLARAIGARVGTKVEGKSFTSYGALRSAKVDFAIISGQCYASGSRYKLLANARIKGGTTRRWALYSSVGKSMTALRGKKLAFIKTGCRDSAFIENAMLESEVGLSFFGGRVGKPDLRGAVAEVVSYKGAQAVFAPRGAGKGLTKLFDTGSVPNPAFVQVNKKLSKDLVGKVRAAVTGFGGGGAISSWVGANRGVYSSLRGRMGRRIKRGIFSSPRAVRIDAKDVLVAPKTLDQSAMTEVKQHFEKPAQRQ